MTRCAECILADVARAFGVTPAAIRARGRTPDVAAARLAAYRLLRLEAGLSKSRIARFVGNRDHSTIHYGLASAEGRLRTDSWFAARYEEARGT